MATYSLGLVFLKPKKGDLPFTPFSHVYIRRSSVCRYKGRDYETLTPRCVGLTEIEYQIDRLKKELEDIRKEARRKFKGYGHAPRSK